MTRIALFLLLGLLASPLPAVEEFGYRIVDSKPHDRRNFVQGLEIIDGHLYVSAGNYGESRLVRYHFDSGEVHAERQLPARVFAEGLTVMGDRIYQLTWRERMLLVYSREHARLLEWIPIAGHGWGLTNNGETLIYTDGGDRLFFLSPATRRVTHSVLVTERGKPVKQLNELEWVDGKVWANIWMTDRIVVIDPDSGEVEKSIDLSGLLPAGERRPDTDVLNGIARNPADGSIWVTGKRWPKLFQIELVPKKSALAENSR